ncbi:hypothetical protein [Methylomonas methanica]|uniref:Uncharacterized protein n=1 Tax=Methylomonas methanica (strain DSM 25384 / MC09) TaxID=857087 RepID=F9ZVB3_METMM|nr:hypothetical protein [Methylomonas methanica]AEG00723.1 hypothetical protein Metme_2321 [Methylomonas methanica MC09]
MTETAASQPASSASYEHLADENLISRIVDVFYQDLLDDYRVNRYFYSRPVEEQTKPLKLLIQALLNRSQFTDKQVWELANDFFTAAFARGNAKPSLVNNRDFAFLEAFVTGDIVNAGKPSELILLCPAHSHLIRLQPNDENYDAVIDNLAAALKQLNIADNVASQILAFAECGRDGTLGRGRELYNEDNMETHFRSHG